MNLRKLDWDSDFFGLQVAELSLGTGEELSVENINKDKNFDLIYVKSTTPILILESSLVDVRLTFSKNLSNSDYNNVDTSKVAFIGLDQYDSLEHIAFQSGEFSRFNRDHRLNAKFKLLYGKWLYNSLVGSLADMNFGIFENGEIVGFLTAKKQETYAKIGLFGIDIKGRGQGFGSQLLKSAENWVIENQLNKLQIPTQEINRTACNFYKKHKYDVIDRKFIYHYWIND